MSLVGNTRRLMLLAVAVGAVGVDVRTQVNEVELYDQVLDQLFEVIDINPNVMSGTSIRITGQGGTEMQMTFLEYDPPDPFTGAAPADHIDVQVVRLPPGSRLLFYQFDDLLKEHPKATAAELARLIPVVRTSRTVPRTDRLAKTYLEGNERLAVRVAGSGQIVLHDQTFRLIVRNPGKFLDVTFYDDSRDLEVVGWMEELRRQTEQMLRK